MFKQILLTAAAGALLAGCAARESTLKNYANPQDDPMYQEIKALVDAESACFLREVQSKSLNGEDLNTAAYAVMGRCAMERERFHAWQRTHTILNPIQQRAHEAEDDANDLQTIRQMIAVYKTSKK